MRFFALILIWLVSSAATQPVLAQTAPPLEAFAALPAIESVSVSPDGATLAYVHRDGGSTKVIAQARSGEILAAVETGALDLAGVEWVSPDHVAVSWITTEHFPLGGLRGDFVIVDILNVRTRGYVRALRRADRNAYTTVFQWRGGIYQGKPVLYAVAPTYENGDLTFDVYRIDLDSGRGFRMVRGDSDTRGYVLSRDGEPVARTAYQSDNGFWRLSTRTPTGWKEIYTEHAPLDAPFLGGVGRTPDSLILQRKQPGGGYDLSEIAMADGSVRETFDLEQSPNGIFHDNHGRMVAMGWIDTYQEYRFFDPKLQQAFDTLRGILPGRQIHLYSFSDDLDVVVFYIEGSGESGGYYLFDAKANRVSLVGRAHPGVSGAQMAEVRAVRYTAQDGRALMGYLTLPTGRAPEDLPVVVLPHGGPASRDEAGFDWLPQAFASRGYAVFQPQFRGSDGFGLDLLEAGYGEWGRKMQSDVSDGLKYLVDRGIVDSERACIVGWSYGGYVALAGMTLEAGTYRCAVSIAGVSDLRDMLGAEQRMAARGDRNPAVRYWTRFMGAENANDPTLDQRSPARLADSKTGPILLVHGRDDVVVPHRQSELMLRALGGESDRARLISMPGEDHSLSGQAQRTTMLVETVAFLERHNPSGDASASR